MPNPVAATGSYRPTGKFESVGDFKEVYTTGPDDAEHALIVIYDIFGFWETTLRVSPPRFSSHLIPLLQVVLASPSTVGGQAYTDSMLLLWNPFS